MNCPECGHALATGARFCSACGRRVISTILEPPPLPRARVAVPPPGASSHARRPPPAQPRAPVARAPAAPAAPRAPRVARKVAPIALVCLGMLVGTAAYWSARHDEAASKALAGGRVALAAAPPTATALETANAGPSFSPRDALEGLYGSYDAYLDGVFWTVTGAPREWAEWNGRPVFIKPLLSRSDASGTRHVLVTSSVEVRDGLVVKQGAGCASCKSLLGAALYERRGDEWVLASELRFMRVEGAFGAPPRVAVDFPGNGGVEVKVDSADSAGVRKPHVAILQGRKPAAATAGSARESATPAQKAADANATARDLVNAAVGGDAERVEAIAAALKRQPRARGDRMVARTLNERGLGLMREERYTVAASVFRQANEADRADPEIRENLGYALLKAGKLAEAEPALLAALETGPDRASAWGSLGQLYARQGERAHAVALLRAAHRMAPNPKQVLDTYARQAETEEDPKVRATLNEAVTRLSSAR